MRLNLCDPCQFVLHAIFAKRSWWGVTQDINILHQPTATFQITMQRKALFYQSLTQFYRRKGCATVVRKTCFVNVKNMRRTSSLKVIQYISYYRTVNFYPIYKERIRAHLCPQWIILGNWKYLHLSFSFLLHTNLTKRWANHHMNVGTQSQM